MNFRHGSHGFLRPYGSKRQSRANTDFLIKQNKIMAKKISINKVARQIKVAYRVNDNEALELVPMFVRKAA